MVKCKYTGSDEGYHYTECGLDYVYLLNGYEVADDPDYGEYIVIHNADKLHQEIARNIVLHRPSLSKQEIKFLRKMMDMTQKEMAALLKISHVTYQGWENPARKHHASQAEQDLMRIIYWDHFKGVDSVRDMMVALRGDREHFKVLSLMERRNNWQALKAA